MRRKGAVKIAGTIIILAAVAVLLAWAFLGSRKTPTTEVQGERPPRVSSREGETVITLDKASMAKSGITVAPLVPASHRSEVRAPGIVLLLQGLFDARVSFTLSTAQAEKASAALEASRREYERLKLLHGDDRNVSDKALQAAEATWRADVAANEAARAALRVLEVTMRQRWGGVISRWLTYDPPALGRLARQEDVLLQVTLPPDAPAEGAAPRCEVRAADGSAPVTARLVSPSPVTDPRIQGRSFFYLAPAGSRLLPGMNVLAFIPVGPSLKGVIVPATAAVWWQGKAWLYLEKGAGRFVRRELPMDAPVKDGWFVPKGPAPGERVVVRGAQLLLSEELRSQIQVLGDEGEEK